MDAVAPPLARAVDEMIEQASRRCPAGDGRDTASSSSSASSATLRNSEKPSGRRRRRSRASVSETPDIGRIPAHCERVQASPNCGVEGRVMTGMTSSRSADVPGARAGPRRRRGRAADQAASRARRRARGRRAASAAAMRKLVGKPQRIGRARPGLDASPQPRASTSAAAPDPTTSRAEIAAAASAGGRLQKRRCGVERVAVELLHEQLAMAAWTAAATGAIARRRPRRARPATTCPAISASQPIASPCAAAIPTRMPVKLPGPTPTRMRSRAAPVEQLVDHRHQPLGMAAADHLVALRDACPVAVEQCGGAGAVDVSIARIIGGLWPQAGWRGKQIVSRGVRPLRRIRPRAHSGGSGFRCRASA